MLLAAILSGALAMGGAPILPIDEPAPAPALRSTATVNARPDLPALSSVPPNVRVNDPSQTPVGGPDYTPAIAVNGYDVLVVWRVIGTQPTQRLRAAYSYDGGNTWTDLGWLPALPGNWRWGVDPCVEVDPSTGIFMIAAQTVDPIAQQTGVAFVTAQPVLGALAWGTPSIIYTTGYIGAFYGDQLEMDYDATSTLLSLVMHDGYVIPEKLIYLASTNRGSSWSPPQTVLSGANAGVGPRVAHVGWSTPLIVHSDFPSSSRYDDGSFQSSRHLGGTSWASPVTVTTHRFDPGSQPGSAADYLLPPTLDVDRTIYLYQDRVYAAWIQSAEFSPWPSAAPYSTLESEPNHSTPQYLGNYSGLVTCSMSSNSDVDLYTVSLQAQEHLVLLPWTMASTGSNTNLRYEILAPDGTTLLGYFSVLPAEAGSARILFTAPRAADYVVRVTGFNVGTYEFQIARTTQTGYPARDRRDLMTSYSTDFGGTWSPPAPLTFSAPGFDAALAELVVANDGRPYLFWLDYSEGNVDGAWSLLEVTRSSDGGVTWETPRTLSSAYSNWQAIPGTATKTGYRIEAATTPIPTDFMAHSSGPRTSYYTPAEDLHVAWSDARDGESNVYTTHFSTAFEVLFVQNDTTAAPGEWVGLRMVLQNRNAVFPEDITPSFVACQRANWGTICGPYFLDPGETRSHYPVVVQIPDTAAAGTVFYQAAIRVGANSYGINTFIHVTPGATGVGGGPTAARRFDVPAPNPAGAKATFRFALAAGDEAALEIFDVAGVRVRALAAGALGAGAHARTWDLRDDSGRKVAAGLYLARLRVGDWSEIRRVAVTR